MTVLLLKVSGVALLEKDIGERRPGLPRLHRAHERVLPGPAEGSRMNARWSSRARRAFAALAVLAAVATAHGVDAPPTSADPAAPGTRVWNFRVMLDGKPIGRHRYSVTPQGERREVRSDADFEVRVLGFVAYRYRHQARERWQRDCLSALDAHTDDDGRVSRIDAARDDAGLRITGADGPRRAARLRDELCLLEPGDARADPPAERADRRAGDAAHRARRAGLGRRRRSADAGRALARQRCACADRSLVLAQGEWVGLDSMVAGGHRLSYRLDTKENG